MNNIIKPKVSVIVPIYNSEAYLDETIKSIINQTLYEIEILLIDDGSTDNSLKICRKYENLDDRIKVFHQKNSGVSTARNVGILNALGEYVSFIDSDDTIESTMYEELYNLVNKEKDYKVDIVDCGFNYVHILQGTSYSNMHNHPKNIIFDRNYILDKVIPPLINLVKDEDNFIYSFITNKLFKLSIIKKYGIKFNENFSMWEDRPFLVEFLYRANTIAFYDKCFYNYIGREGSLSSKYNPNEFELVLETFDRYKKLFGDSYDFDGDYAIKHKINAIMITIEKILINEKNKIIKKQKVINILSNNEVIDWYNNINKLNYFDSNIKKFVLAKRYRLAYGLCVLRFSYIIRKLNLSLDYIKNFYIRFKNKVKRSFLN